MINKSEIYYAKILLFGEYSVIHNSMGLTIPYTHFRGELSSLKSEKYTNLDFAQNSNKSLKEYSKHLRCLQEAGDLLCEFDVDALDQDIKNGLYFESSIPQGYGLGSSGALVCALYSTYAKDKIPNSRNLSNEELLNLKSIFSQMESFFHGKSSGLDPLNCYIQYPLLIQGNSTITPVGIPRRNNAGSGIFLLNTHQIGKTEPLVNLFLHNCDNPEYFERVQNELIPVNNACIESILDGDADKLFQNLEKLSRFELENLNDMIPENYQSLWKEGLDTGDFTLKLCGSGGGGFLLGFTKNYNATRRYLDSINQEVITVYQSHL